MEKTVEATRIAPHGLFYMENAGGTHSTAMPPTLIAKEQIADEHQPSCFAWKRKKRRRVERRRRSRTDYQ